MDVNIRQKMIHYQIYQQGSIGMVNALMSVENGLILANELELPITFYHTHKIFNSTKGLKINDFFDICEVIQDKRATLPLVSAKFVDGYRPHVPVLLNNDFHGTAITWLKDLPSGEFMNNRSKWIVLDDYYKKYPEIATLDSQTLAFYSYLFHGDKNKMTNLIEKSIKPKQIYIDEAKKFIKKPYNSISVRRGDYLHIPNMKNVEMQPIHYKHIIDNNFSKKLPLLIHTDETNEEHFKDLEHNYVLIQNLIDDKFDPAEKGLISALIAMEAEDFIGTHYSTFSAWIQRKRYIKRKEEFKYLYSQEAGIMLDEKGTMITNGRKDVPTWRTTNQLQEISFWTREYPECIK